MYTLKDEKNYVMGWFFQNWEAITIGILTIRGYAPAGIRTRVGSSGGSQDIHYPTRADRV